MKPGKELCFRWSFLSLFALLFMFGVSIPAPASEPAWLTVVPVGEGGAALPAIHAYRWLIEEDKTYHVQTDSSGVAIPTQFDPNWEQAWDGHPGGETLSLGFHQSYMPVVAKGCAGWEDVVLANPNDPCAADVLPAGGFKPNTHYYVSVLPRYGFGGDTPGATLGGASFKTDSAGNIPPTTVYVNGYPIKTAQITILVFHDNAPINNAPDLPTEEPGLLPGQTDMSGFQIIVEDAGGRYGASAGIMSQDVFGNPLGTQYDAAGNVIGYQPLVTGPDGRLTIKNLAPGKYGIQAVPPTADADLTPVGNFPGPEDIDRDGDGILDSGVWQQTATIEGTKVIDAWVKAGEPPYFAEFGPPGFHVFVGFVKEFNTIPSGGGAEITGTIVNQHLSRPPDYAFFNGGCFGHTTPWVGLNTMVGGRPGVGLYAAPTDENCNFTIPAVPDGNYQLVVWDNNLDLIFAFKGITIEGGVCSTPTGCSIGDVPVFQWFHRQEHRVFDDANGNGSWDSGEGPSALEQAFNLRWRDGTIYQTNVSDGTGAYAFDQVFPFFAWLVAEVDFTRFQATGLTVVVDNGGQISAAIGDPPLDGNDLTFGRALNPQDQTNPPDPACGPNDTDPCTETPTHRVERGPVLTQGFQGFLGQTNAFLWGKRHYPDRENGGISGIVFYAVTRAENDPEFAAAEVWEPGIPGVTVNLYDATGNTLLATTTTDSWDENIPTGCKWGNGATGPYQFTPDGTTFYPTDCYDGLRVFNQSRPAVFDGGYAFGPSFDCDEFGGTCPDWLDVPDPDGANVGYLKPADYVIEVVPPPGYEIVKPEDKNVDFGDEIGPPVPELLPAKCVGSDHLIPPFLTLYPDQQIPSPFAWNNGVYQPTYRSLCDRKLVTLSAGANAAADFWLFTEVPVAAHGYGFILDDTQSEFDPNSPQFGEKFAPPFLPITIRDFTGRVIGKTLSDQFGVYNFLGPSTVTANLPAPSGMSPNMLTTCMNDPGDDPENPDPNWNQQYSTFCYTFQYMPGVTTYLDTPVVPVAAFAGPEQFPLDCEYPDGTPRIDRVSVETNGVGGGPYIPTVGNNNRRLSGDQTITITSVGRIPVPNPEYCNPAADQCPPGADTVNKTIFRQYGFGTEQGTVTLGGTPELPLTVTDWNNDTITATLAADTPVGAVAGRQLTVTNSNDLSTVAGITVQVGLRQNASVLVVPAQYPTIQAAINAASSNDLVLVAPGTYPEMVVMWKPVQLQGWGEGSTIINALKAPAENLLAWRTLVDGLIASRDVDLLPGQQIGTGIPEAATLQSEEGAGVLVLARSSGNGAFDTERNRGARFDGFTVKSADTGGGLIVNGYADYLDISNNRISNNTGFYGGGIRVGHPILTTEGADGNVTYTDGDNDFVNIHNNQVVFNGGLGGAGGGISMCTGSDSYRVTRNWVCGNFTQGEGAGIAHYGKSDGTWITVPGNGPQNQRVWTLTEAPAIKENTVLFNESFFQGQTVSGGGIFVGGAAPLTPGALSPGAGNVVINRNLIQGNSAGAGDGGGIRLAMVNGQDIAANPTNAPRPNGNAGSNGPIPWNRVDVFNNMIANNVAGLAGGGISLQDAVNVRLIHNTVANNDSLATAGDAFTPGNPNLSNPLPGAGIASRSHSQQLDETIPGNTNTFSNPVEFADNIIWQNRQFYFKVADGTPGDPANTGVWGLCPEILPPGGTPVLACGTAPVYSDLGVIGTAGALTCASCLETPVNPEFQAWYANGGRSSVIQPEITTAIQAPPAFDEGGNFIKPVFGPLSLYQDATPDNGDPGTLFGDYHISAGSPAVDAGNLDSTNPSLATDFDGEPRPQGSGVDIGADEAQ